MSRERQTDRRAEMAQQTKNTDNPTKPRRIVPIVILLAAVATLAWVLRGVPHRYIVRAENAIRSWRFQEAEQILGEYPSWGTDAAKVAFLQARTHRYQEGFVRALAYLRESEDIGFDPASIRLEKTLIAMQNVAPNPQILGQFESLLHRAQSDRPEVYQFFANAQFASGNVDAAMAILDQWIETFPDDGRSYYWKGWIYEQRRDDRNALDMFVRSTSRDPGFVDAYLARARIRTERFEYQHALGAYREVCRICPERADTRISLARLLWRLDQKAEAVNVLLPVTRGSSAIYPAGQLVARYHAQRGEHENVIATIRPMMNSFPDDASLNYMLASAYRETADVVGSNAAMQKFFDANKNLDRLRASPFDVPLPQQYAELIRRAALCRQYDWVQTSKWLNYATQSQPDNPEPHVLLARHCEESGSMKNAIRHRNIAESLSQQASSFANPSSRQGTR